MMEQDTKDYSNPFFQYWTKFKHDYYEGRFGYCFSNPTSDLSWRFYAIFSRAFIHKDNSLIRAFFTEARHAGGSYKTVRIGLQMVGHVSESNMFQRFLHFTLPKVATD